MFLRLQQAACCSAHVAVTTLWLAQRVRTRQYSRLYCR